MDQADGAFTQRNTHHVAGLDDGAAAGRLRAACACFPGTYFRWEAPPGVHRITGDEADFGTIALETGRGRIYFVEQQLSERHDVSYFSIVDEQHGRAVVGRAALLAGW